MRAWLGLGVTLGVLSLGCATEIVDVTKDQEVVKVPVSFAAVEPCNEAAGIRPDFFIDYWNCGQVIWIDVSALPTTPNLRGEATSAMAAWNAAIGDEAIGVPTLTTAGGTGVPRVQVTLGSQGSQYCGQVLVSGVPNRINMAAGNCGTFRNVFLHELSHVFGFQDTWEKTGVAGVSNHCARFLPSGKASNSTVCQHEVESLHRHYGIGPATEPSLSKHILTGIVGKPSSILLKVGETRTVTLTSFQFLRAHPSFGTSAAPSGTMSWTETSAAFHLTGTGAFSRTVVPDEVGSGILRIRPTSTTYELAGTYDPDVNVTVNPGDPPAGPPTNLQASNITATAATISWTNGDATATTVLQYRLTGTSPWTTANGGVALPAGTSSYRLTGLHCSTSYDVNVFHRKNGVDSPWLTLTLFTTAGCTISSTINPPSSFRETGCTPSTSGGKNYATYRVAWTAGANPSTSIFHIVESFSNSPGSAIIRRGPISTTVASLGPYLVQSTSSARYFWVRHANGAQASAWVALQSNPIRISIGCA
jgi:hypothetical protein